MQKRNWPQAAGVDFNIAAVTQSGFQLYPHPQAAGRVGNSVELLQRQIVPVVSNGLLHIVLCQIESDKFKA